MTITFDRVGDCTKMATVVVEGYSPKDGLAHGSLDVTVKACDACHQAVRAQLIDCGMTPCTISPASTWVCGDRSIYNDNEYTTNTTQ